MARVQIPVTAVDRDGAAQPTQTTANATDDHYVTGGADGMTMLEIASTDGSSRIVEILPNPDFEADGLTVDPLSIAVGAGLTVVAGPFRTNTFKQNVTNDLWVNPSVSTTLKFRAYRLEPPS